MPKRRRKLGPFVGPGGVLHYTYDDLRKAINEQYRSLEQVRTLNDPGTEDIGRPALYEGTTHVHQPDSDR